MTARGSQRETVRSRRLWCAWLPALLLLCLALPSPLQAADRRTPPVMLAVLVGSGVYHGAEEMPPLRYADDDVLRFARAMRVFVAPENMSVLMSPDEEVASAARAMGLNTWATPGRSELLIALSRIEARTRQIHASSPGTPVQVVLFLSAHGDSFGVHLADGILTGGELQEQLDHLSAETILLVADSCFSDSWLGLKGRTTAGTAGGSTRNGKPAARAPLPIDAVAAAVRDLERVGAVTAQSYTREERTLIRGGLVTHVISSALMGPADLDQDGRILYDELRAYLTTYGRRAGFSDGIRVRQPRRPVSQPAALVDLTRLERQGLSFERSGDQGAECFWIRTAAGQLVGEFCKQARERRRVYLPAGRYLVQWRNPPDRGWGREGEIDVAKGFTSIKGQDLSGYWLSSLFKGEAVSGGPPIEARRMSDEESSYMASTPFQAAVTWRELPGRRQVAVRAGSSLPIAGLSGRAELQSLEVSLTQERPAFGVDLVNDWRIAPAGAGFLQAGIEAGIAASPQNRFDQTAGATVWQLDYRARLGLERPIRAWTGRIALSLGGIGVVVAGGEQTAAEAGRQPVAVGYQSPAAAAVTGLELGIGRGLRRGWRLELGVAPQLVIEPRLLGPEQVLVLAPYLGGRAFAGVRW